MPTPSELGKFRTVLREVRVSDRVGWPHRRSLCASVRLCPPRSIVLVQIPVGPFFWGAPSAFLWGHMNWQCRWRSS